MNCPHKDKPFPPCQVVPHSLYEDVYFCKICQQSYNIRDIGQPFPISWFVVILSVLLTIFSTTLTSEPVPPKPPQLNPISQTDMAL